MPFPVQSTHHSHHRQSDSKEEDFKTKMSEYISVLNKHRNDIKLSDLGMKVTVSDYAMAHWYCQIFKLDINNLTQSIPHHLTRE